MGFLCPICRTATLEAAALEEGLPTERCGRCGGHWVTSARYFAFMQAPREKPVDGAGAPVADPPHMKMCPTCLKFMRYYPVGHGAAFGVDKCGTCGGVWLNAGEWEAMKARGLHRELHAISSDEWQVEVQRQRRAEAEEAAMERRLGRMDYAELLRVAGWLNGHSHRAEILAYLQLKPQHAVRSEVPKP